MMFDSPEYASYVALCRELRLEREYEKGDYYTAPVPVSTIAPDGYEVLVWISLYRLPNANEECTWLPRLDQWLDLLEEEGYATIEFCARAIDMERYLYGAHPDNMASFTGWLSSREEAAARLWMAVVGRKEEVKA